MSLRLTVVRLLPYVFGYLCLIASMDAKAGKFPILVYHDPVTVHYFWDSTHLADSLAHRYFSEMQDFGINIVIGETVSHTATLCDTFGIELTPYNWIVDAGAPNRLTPIADVKPYYLQTFVSNGRWFQMEAEVDQDLSKGYAFSDLTSDTTTGANALEYGFRYASPTLHSPGYLFRQIDTINYKDWNASGAPVREDARGYVIDSLLYSQDSLRYAKSCFIMRYDSASNDTSVIAQIRVINPGNYWPHRLVTIRNNEWFVDDSGVAHYQGDIVHYPRFDIGLNTWVDSVGFIDATGDAIGMGLVYKSIRDIRPSDFGARGLWDTLYAIYPWYYNKHLVWWYGNARLDIDRFYLTNETSRIFRDRLDNTAQRNDMRDNIDDMYDTLGIDSSLADIIKFWYVRDEPYNGTYYPLRHARELLKASQNNPGVELRAARDSDDPSEHCLEILSGIAYCPETMAEVESFFGHCDVKHYSNADTSDIDNPQYWWDKSIADLAIQRQKAADAGLKFFPIVYPGSGYDHDTLRHVRIATRREPFGNDIKCQAFLCVAYGADGIAYYPYISYGPAPGAAPESMYQEMFRLGTQDKSATCPEYPDDSVTWDARSFIIANQSTGIFYKVNDSSTGYKWDAAKQVHGVLNRLADTLNGRVFVSADQWNQLTGGPFKYITSQEYGDTAAFVQWSEFTSDGTPYYMLINRRTWPGPEACQCPDSLSDAQHVYFALDAGPSGDVWAYDICTNDSLLLIDSAGYKTGVIYLPPGEAAIFRLKDTRYNWKGSFAGTDHFPEGGTHYLSGDITIDSGSTFTIGRGATLKAIANTDSCAAGTNTTKTELIVKGHLRAIGTSSDSVRFNATTDTTAAWYGIRVIDSGSADIRYTEIRNAYIGYENTSTNASDVDTLQYVGFSKCRPKGAVIAKNNMAVSNITVTSDRKTAEGIHVDSAFYGTIANCTFNYVKYAVEVDHSSPRLSQLYFNQCINGIRVDNYSVSDTVRIDHCSFDNYDSSVTVDFLVGQNRAKVKIDSCSFQYVTGPYVILNIYDQSYVRVRHTDFTLSLWYMGAIAAYTNGQNTDLGGLTDWGYNYFEQFKTPGYCVYNSSTTCSTNVHYCCYFDGDPFYYYFHGPVAYYSDTSWYNSCVRNFPKNRVGDEVSRDTEVVSFKMSQNHPNPFNPTTTIAYSIPEACDVKVMVYNVLGQVVTTLVDEHKAPGEYAVTWDGNDADGRPVASGMYFYQMRAGQYTS
ncbi:MAG: FlgD immunoglobulin-like domain containing protein, partial [candidate division Zixibacteria bacterium]|nr:FlgD immunoglobulin-like domain containing protein [candidate division Zixibacteria bacterium]